MKSSPTGTYDLAIIGGGVNGCAIARAAAGRGWSVFLCEKNDLGSATSSASTKLVHGGLRYLEQGEFRLVRESLMEREVLWAMAPHIVWPLRFVLPHHKGLRPAWLLRLGLLIYDHLGGRHRLPPTRIVRLRQDFVGAPLKPGYTLAFEYSDCWVEDSRLVVLTAMDAAARGAVIAPRTPCIGADRDDAGWTLRLEDARTAGRFDIRARVLVNAAGPWAGQVLQIATGSNAPGRVRLVKGSHIVVPRLYPGEQCYIFQNSDGRIVFVIPYEQDFALIGTTDMDYEGDPADASASADEIAYLCQSVSEYLMKPVSPGDVVWTYSGVRPLHDDGTAAAQKATRDYVLELDATQGRAPLLSILGGKITTHRRLGEAAVARLEACLPAATGLPPGWTRNAPLPGGGMGIDGLEPELARLKERYPFVADKTLQRWLRAYGTNVADLVGPADDAEALGPVFGADLTEAEIRYLARAEWATTAADVVWRRSKLGLRMTSQEVASVETFMAELARSSVGREPDQPRRTMT